MFWCPSMAIKVGVQHNDGFLPGIILLTLCYYHPGTRFKCHEEFFFLLRSLMFTPTQRFDNFSPFLGDARKVFQMRSDFSLNWYTPLFTITYIYIRMYVPPGSLVVVDVSDAESIGGVMVI